MYRLLNLLIIVLPFLVQSQTDTTIQLSFRDVHLSNVEHILMEPKGDYFFTADANGKILMWDALNFNVIKTLQSETGARITGMTLVNENKTLLCTTGSQGRFAINGERTSYSYSLQFDKVVFINPYTEDSIRSLQASMDILGADSDSILLIGFGENMQGALMGVDRKDVTKEYFRFNSDKIISKAVLSPESDLLAYSEYQTLYSGNMEKEYTFRLVKIESKETLYTKKFIDEQVVSIVFSPDGNSVHLFVFNRNDRKLRIEALELNTMKLKKYHEIEMTDVPDKVFVQDNEQKERTVILTGMFSGDHILHFANGQLKAMPTGIENRQNKQTVSTMALLPDSDLLLICNSINSYFGLNPEIVVWNKKAMAEIARFYEPQRTANKGLFLPEDHWMVFGQDANKGAWSALSPMKTYFKFYEAGTLNNRFAQLKFNDYIEQKYGVSFYSDAIEYVVDEQSGSLAFVAILPTNDPYSGRMTYLKYDLLKDELDTTNTVKVDYMIPIEWVKSKNRLLVKKCMSCQEFAVIDGNKQIDFKGDFNEAHLSKSGEYIVLLNALGELSIQTVDGKKVLYKKREEGWKEYAPIKLGTGGPDEFWISYQAPDSTGKFMEYRTLVLDCSNGKVIEQEFINRWFSGASTSNGMTALIMDGLGVYLSNQKVIPFDYYHTPKYISLNSSGKRIMISHINGTVELYDTESLERIGVMYHPDNYSYIIIDNSGHFASNISAQTYVQSMKGKEEVSFELIPSSRQQPEKLLELFGLPDNQYLEFLKMGSAMNRSKIADNVVSNTAFRNIRIQGKVRLETTDSKTIRIDFLASSSTCDLTELRVSVNNVPALQQKLNIPKGEEGQVNFQLNLYNGENTIGFYLVDKNGYRSPTEFRTIYYTKKDQEKGNLYVMTIGVSDYPGEENDLTFADKDALDLALIYSDTLSFDLENYQHKFFGNRFSVNGDKGTLYAEIRQYDGVYSSYKSLKQVDISGKRWLEDLNHQDYYLWDFEKTIRIKIDIDLYPYLLNNAIYADPNDQGFCYLSKDEVWKYFSFENRQSKKIKKPEEDDLIYLGESNWLRIEEKSEQNISTVTIGVSKGDEALSSIDYELEFQDESNFKLLGATVDRSSVLISTHSNLYLIKRGPGEQQVQKVIWPGFDKGDSYQFTSNGSMINCIKTNYAADQNTTTDAGYWVINYNIGKAMLDSIFYKEVELTDYTGFNNFGGSVRWINTKNPIAKEEGFLTNESEKRSKIKPVSFNNTYVKVLLNEQATNEEILKNIDQFFSTATENDEVILFFAGHGMLDSMLNFYFAAHDMDFTQPDKKGIGYQVILDKLGQLPMSRKLVLLDACHSGNLFSPVFNEQKDSMGDYAKGRGAETETLEDNNLNLTDHLSEVYDLLFGSQTDKYGVNVIAASSGANLAYESGELSNGAFTGAYIESILSNFRSNFSSSIDSELVSPVPLTNETLYYFRKKVLDDTNGLQSPSVRSINNTVRILLF